MTHPCLHFRVITTYLSLSLWIHFSACCHLTSVSTVQWKCSCYHDLLIGNFPDFDLLKMDIFQTLPFRQLSSLPSPSHSGASVTPPLRALFITYVASPSRTPSSPHCSSLPSSLVGASPTRIRIQFTPLNQPRLLLSTSSLTTCWKLLFRCHTGKSCSTGPEFSLLNLSSYPPITQVRIQDSPVSHPSQYLIIHEAVWTVLQVFLKCAPRPHLLSLLEFFRNSTNV